MSSGNSQEEYRKFYSGKNVLVTGASGYVASSLVPKLFSLGAKVTLAARSPKATVLGSFSFLQASATAPHALTFLDIANRNELTAAAADCDVLFHLAGQTSLRKAEEDPQADLEANVELSLRVLEAFSAGNPSDASVSARAILFAGTATTVGLVNKWPVKDGCAAAPVSVYDLHKSVVERYVEYFAKEKSCTAVVLRLANVYGPSAVQVAADRGILQKTAKAALQGQKITVFGTGEYIRDYVFLDDVTDAFLCAGQHAKKLSGKSCFVATGEGRSVKAAFTEVADQAEKLTGKKVPLQMDPQAPVSKIDTRNFSGTASYLKEHAGWEARVKFADGVVKTLEAFREN